jgi:hypothetical protein
VLYYKIYCKKHLVKGGFIAFCFFYNSLKGLEEVSNIFKSLPISRVKDVLLIELLKILLLVFADYAF